MSFGGSAQKSSSTQNTTQTYTPSGEFLNLVQPGLSSAMGLMGNYRRTSGEDVNQYLNPYLGQVADVTSQQIGRSRDIAANNLDAQAAKAGAFGGSGWGLLRGENQRAYADAEAQALAGINAGGYNTALQAAMGENQNASAYDLNALQTYLSGLGLLGNWGTSTGTANTKSKGMGLNFGFTYGGGGGS